MLNICNGEPRDYEIVENITHNAFYNLYMPGCVEHHLIQKMRKHEDFIHTSGVKPEVFLL